MLSRRHRLSLVLALVILVAGVVAAPVSAMTASPAAEGGQHASATAGGVVRVVMFWMKGCSHCELVKTQTLPPLQQKYGDKLDIVLIEIMDAQSADRLDRVAQAMGFKAGEYGVPFLVIGDTALMGSGDIPAKLPGLVEKYMAAGGVDVPNIAGLTDMTMPSSSKSSPSANGFALAWVVMALLAMSLLYVAYVVLRYVRGTRAPLGPAWLQTLFPIICVLGMAVAFYLSYVETTKAVAVCGPVGDCNSVQNSPYAKLFGVLPVGVLGLGGYIAILAAWLWARYRKDTLAAYAPSLIFAMALFGVLFSVYLTYLELFVIKAVCAWCLASAVFMAITLALSVGPALRSLADE